MNTDCMSFFYQSGQEVRAADKVTYHGEPGEIEFVAENLAGDSGTDWYVTELGGGVMIREPKVFGRVFVSNPSQDEDLVFVARDESA